jgi:hypothetical protein
MLPREIKCAEYLPDPLDWAICLGENSIPWQYLSLSHVKSFDKIICDGLFCGVIVSLN